MWRRWGTSHLLVFIDELWKPEKTEFWKNEKNLLEISLFYTCVPNPPPLAPHCNPEKWNFGKNQKSIWTCHHFKLVQQKPQSYDLYLLTYGVQQTSFYHFRPFFALLPQYWTQILKFGKRVKTTWRYYPFTHVHHKSRSFDVWFLGYKVQRTEFFFVILGHFLLFYPTTDPTN